MSALEEMRPFFRLCQCVGFFPFRMEIDRRTGKFRQFSFSWRNPVTWWYIALALSQFITFGAVLATAVNTTTGRLKKLPITISMSLSVYNIIYLIFLISARFWVTLYFSKLHEVIRQIKIVDQFLRQRPNCRCTIKIRIFIGIIFSFLWICSSTFVLTKENFSRVTQYWGYFITSVLLCVVTFTTMTVCCACLFMHLAYYLTGYYIRLLRHRLLSNSISSVNTTVGYGRMILTPGNLPRIHPREFDNVKKSQRIFGVICKASAEWNQIFSFPALFIISTKLLSSAFSVFNFIQGLILPNDVLIQMRWSLLVNFLVDIFFMMIVFTAAEIPVQNAGKLREKVIEISNNRFLIQPMVSTRESLQAIIFLEQIREDRLRLSTGFFTVGVHLVPTITGSILTYFVILLQQTSNKQQ